MRLLVDLLREEQGQDLVEYALLASFIAMVTLSIVRSIGIKLSGYYTTIGGAF